MTIFKAVDFIIQVAKGYEDNWDAVGTILLRTEKPLNWFTDSSMRLSKNTHKKGFNST